MGTESIDWLEYLKIGISLLTLAGIVIAFLNYRASISKLNEDRARERDKELLSQAQNSLQWAYDALTAEGTRVPPEPDRLNWLTSSRHLLRGKSIAAQISGETYRTVYDEIEEFWRHKFYLALPHERLRNWTYFADQSQPTWPERIEVSSALVVVDFSNWKDGNSDPTDGVDRDYLIKHGGVLKGGYAGRGLEGYLCRFEEIRAARNTSASADT